MEKIKLKGLIREERGTEESRRLRKKGFIPAVIYTKGINFLIKIPHQEMKILKSIHFSESVMIEMEIQNSDKNKKEIIPLIIKDIQFHPLTEEVIHLDFIKVSLEEKIKVNVPLILKGEPQGLKEEGVLEQILWEVEIEGFPLDIPPHIEVDISSLGVGDSLHAKDLPLPANLKLVTSGEETVVTLVTKKEEEAVEEVEVSPEEEAEPEVIKEKPKEEKQKQEE